MRRKTIIDSMRRIIYKQELPHSGGGGGVVVGGGVLAPPSSMIAAASSYSMDER